MNLTPEEKMELLELMDNYIKAVRGLPDTVSKLIQIRTLIEYCPESRTEEERREFVEKWAKHFLGVPIDEKYYDIRGFRKNIRDMLAEWDTQKATINEKERIGDNPDNNTDKVSGRDKPSSMSINTRHSMEVL